MFTNQIIMHLYIEANRLIGDIQNEFNKMFPFLKIEFFKNKSLLRSDFSSNQIIPHNRKIGEGQLAMKDGEIEIDKEMKVIELEKHFRDQFNLSVQVFRKSGNLWLETTMTDNWTLQQQNNHGRELSTGENRNPGMNDLESNRQTDL